MLGGNEGCTALDHEPLVGRVRWRPNENLWVEPFGVKPQEEAIACFDEVSSEGVLLRRVHVVVPGSKPEDELLLLEDGRFVLLSGFGAPAEEGGSEDLRAEVSLLVVE